jgi:hypothetical protein
MLCYLDVCDSLRKGKTSKICSCMTDTVLEQGGWHYSEESNLDLISICPSLAI